MTLFEILDSGLVIVAHDTDQQRIVTWNGANTLSLWQHQGLSNPGSFEESEVKTHGGSLNLTMRTASKKASEWLHEDEDHSEE